MAARRKRIESKTELGRVLYLARAERGWSLDAMAEYCGLAAHTQVSRWEAGLEVPGLIYLLRIGAVATGEARRTIVEACRQKVMTKSLVAGMTEMLREVAARG